MKCLCWQDKNPEEGSRGVKAHGKQVNQGLQKRYKGSVLEQQFGWTQTGTCWNKDPVVKLSMEKSSVQA